jgi:hypothetical protein
LLFSVALQSAMTAATSTRKSSMRPASASASVMTAAGKNELRSSNENVSYCD